MGHGGGPKVADNKAEGLGVASSGTGSYGAKSGVSAGAANGGTSHSSGSGGVVRKTHVGAEELPAKARVGNGGQHHPKLLTSAAAATQSAGVITKSLLSTHCAAGDMLCTTPIVCDMECSVRRRERCQWLSWHRVN